MTHAQLKLWRGRVVTAGHYLAAFVLAMKGISYLEYARAAWPFIAFCFATSAIVAGATFFHHRIEARLPSAPAIIYFTECLVCVVVAWRAYLGGKAALPYAWAAAAVMLAIAGVLTVRKAVRQRRLGHGSH